MNDKPHVVDPALLASELGFTNNLPDEAERAEVGFQKLREAIALAIPVIQSKKANFFLENQMDVLGAEAKLKELYTGHPKLKNLHEGLGSIARALAVNIRHIAFFLVEQPDKGELKAAIRGWRDIMKGKFFNETEGSGRDAVINLTAVSRDSLSKAFPSLFIYDENKLDNFVDFPSLRKVMEKALFFLKETEIYQLTVEIFNSSEDPKVRAANAKEIIERHLARLRELVLTDEPLPETYKPDSEVTKAINLVRDSILV